MLLPGCSAAGQKLLAGLSGRKKSLPKYQQLGNKQLLFVLSSRGLADEGLVTSAGLARQQAHKGRSHIARGAQVLGLRPPGRGIERHFVEKGEIGRALVICPQEPAGKQAAPTTEKTLQTKKAEPQNRKRSTRPVHISKIVIASTHTSWDEIKSKANKK